MNHKKIQLVLALLLICSLFSFKVKAQIIPITDSTNYHNLSFVIKGGITHIPATSLPDDFMINSAEGFVLHRLCNINTKISYYTSLGMEYQLTKKLSLRASLDYYQDRTRLDYQQRYNASGAWSASIKGTFEQNQRFWSVPITLAYSFGKKIRYQMGAGAFGFTGKNISGTWDSFNSPQPGEENCEVTEVTSIHHSGMPMPLLRTSNFGALVQTQINIPISWSLEFMLGGQYRQTFGRSAPPFIIKKQFIFETGFRFKLIHDSW